MTITIRTTAKSIMVASDGYCESARAYWIGSWTGEYHVPADSPLGRRVAAAEPQAAYEECQEAHQALRQGWGVERISARNVGRVA